MSYNGAGQISKITAIVIMTRATRIISINYSHKITLTMVASQNRVNKYPSNTATKKYKTSALKKASMCFLGFW